MKLQAKFESHFAGKNRSIALLMMGIANYLAINLTKIEEYLYLLKCKGIADMDKYMLLSEKLYKEENLCSPAGEPIDPNDIRNLLKLVRKEVFNQYLNSYVSDPTILKIFNPADFEGDDCFAYIEFEKDLKKAMCC